MIKKIHIKFQIAFLVFFVSLYVVTMKGICTGDNVFHYDKIQNIIKNGSLSMPEGKYDFDKHKWLRVFMAEGRDGRIYLTLGDGLSLAATPFASIGNVIEKIIDVSIIKQRIAEASEKGNVGELLFNLRKLPSAFFSALINPVVMGLTVLLFFNFSFSLTHSISKSFLSSIILGTGTIIWAYSSTFWTQPIVTFCLFAAFFCLFQFKRKPKYSYLLISGTLLGYSLITRYPSVITFPIFLFYIIAIKWREKRKLITWLSLFILPFAFFILLQLGWNFYRFGSVFNLGAKHQSFLRFSFAAKPYISLPAMLIGPNKSIFIFSPPLLLFLFSIKKFFRVQKLEMITLYGIIFIYLAFYSKFSFWRAYASWGPRFLVPITPFLLLPVCIFLDRVQWKRILIFILFAIGIIVQLVGVLLPLHSSAIEKYFDGVPKTVDYFTKSEIVPQVSEILSGKTEFWFLDNSTKLTIGLILILVCIASFSYCIRYKKKLVD